MTKRSWRPSSSIAIALIACACVGEVGNPGADAGVASGLDASVDASVDAGSMPTDAGRSPLDAGQPFLPTEFGPGDEAGTFANDVWSPGRNDAGVVTLKSWASVPTGRGVVVSGTRLDALDAVVKAAVPGWSDYGVSDWNGVLDNWNGFALDPDGSRGWLVSAGGHSGSSNNGIYRFDVLRMAWAVEQLPSDPAPWSTAYKNKANGSTFTPCDESNEQLNARIDAGTLSPINDWYWDELFWDRTPTSRHVYSSAVYVSGRDELVLAVRRFWRYSLREHRWVYKRLINDRVEQVMAGSGTYAFFDEKTDDILMGGVGDALYQGFSFNLQTESWSGWAQFSGLSGVADERTGRFITGFSVPAQTDFAYASPGLYFRYSLDSRTNVTQGEIQYGPGLSRTDFPSGYAFYDGTALCYVPELDRYWVATLVNGSMQFLELDPTTAPWTLRRMTLPGLPPTFETNLMRKLIYWPRLHAVTLTGRGDADLWLYKLGQ